MKNSNQVHYNYIGPKSILKRVQAVYKGSVIKTTDDIVDWLKANNEKIKIEDITICTFVIDLDNQLLIVNRHSEHVQCAFGKDVLSAGEIGFIIEKENRIRIDSITNQSTGYCPAASSWIEVKKALQKIEGLSIPNGFEPTFVFSYCLTCQTRQIVKEAFYYCPLCEGELLSEAEFQDKRRKLVFS